MQARRQRRQRRRQHRTCGARSGFTLIELMVVIVILGLMSGIAFVSWEAILPKQQLNTALHRLSDALHATRSEAIARNREFRIYYDIGNNRYHVQTPYLLGGGFATAENGDEDRRIIDRVDLGQAGIELLQVTIDDVTYSDGSVYVRFDPLGAASYHRVVLRQALFDRTFTIEALPLTGDIRFHDGVFERDIATEKDFE